MTIQSEAEEKKILEIIVASAEEFLQSAGKELNYQKITDNILDISGAKYASFELYDEDGTKFTIVAISAPEGIIKKASSLLGFKLLGKRWEHGLVRVEKIKFSTITHFSSLLELTGDVISKPIVSLLEKTFNLGEVILVKILNENIMIGNFTLIMPKNARFKNENYVEIYSRQLGLLITRRRSEVKLIESEIRLRSVFAAVSDPIFLLDQETGAILDVNDAACSLYGYARDEMLKLKNTDMSAEPKKSRKALKEGLTFVPVRYHKKKDGTIFPTEITASLVEPNGRKLSTISIRDITERRNVEEALRKSEEKFSKAFHSGAILMAISSIEEGCYLDVNEAFLKTLGFKREEVIGKTFSDLDIFVDKEQIAAIKKIFDKKGRVSDIEVLVKGRDGIVHTGIFTADPVDIADKPCWLTTVKDITERKKVEEALLLKTMLLEAQSETSIDGILAVDNEGHSIFFNKRFGEIWKIPQQILDTKDDKKMLEYVSEQLKDPPEFSRRVEYLYKHKDESSREEIRLADGRYFDRYTSPSISADGNNRGRIWYFRDITEHKKTEKEITYLSFHDHLTGLYNRRFFEVELKRLDTERQLPLSFIMGDLNGLKLINDVFGHVEGDELLKETAEILKRVCRSDDILARWGGDEFVLLLPQTLVSGTEEIVERIKKECKKTKRQKISISLSLGTAIKESEVQNIQTIVIDAESNMYKNKLVEKESLTSSIIFALEQALYEKSNETKEHTDRMHDFAIKLGKSIKLHSSGLDELSLLVSLHDIGKVAIPENILLKKAMLTEKEWKVIKRHPEIGFNIAQSSSQIAHIAKPILYCHENWDGSGYPLGIAGESIPVISRIILIVDAYDVMTRGRIYKLPISKDDAIKELKRCAGSQFDPVLIDKFIKILARQRRI